MESVDTALQEKFTYVMLKLLCQHRACDIGSRKIHAAPKVFLCSKSTPGSEVISGDAQHGFLRSWDSACDQV